jgi:hypothetical protein
MYFQTGQVIFVPEWPKGEFVSILALFCVWTKSLMCNDAVNRDSTFRVMSEDFSCKLEEFQVPCQPSERCVIPFRRPSFYCCIRPDIRQTSIICPDNLFLERFTDSFKVQEREDQSTVRTMWYPVRTRISVR